MKRLLLWLIHFYQKKISPLKPPCCRFVPSCSAYAVQAIGRFGAFKGTALAAWRILRCNPLFPGGYDPVPEKRMKYRPHPPENNGEENKDGNGN